MPKHMQTLVAMLVALTLTAGCAELSEDKERTGAIAGGAVGAVIGQEVGDSTLATVLGAVAGSLLGERLGRYLEERDRQQTAQALEANEAQSWSNPETGNQYAVKPVDTFERNGQTCRRFVMDAQVDGKTEEVEGVACRQSDGTWRMVS